MILINTLDFGRNFLFKGFIKIENSPHQGQGTVYFIIHYRFQVYTCTKQSPGNYACTEQIRGNYACTDPTPGNFAWTEKTPGNYACTEQTPGNYACTEQTPGNYA